MLRYLKGIADFGLKIQASKKLVIHAFVDSDWASDKDDKRSTSGYAIVFSRNLISLRYKKQYEATRYSTEAEYKSIAQVTFELCWLKNLVTEFLCDSQLQ